MSGRWRVGRRGSEWRGRPWLVLRGGEWEAAQWDGPVLTLEARQVARRVPTSSRPRPIRPPSSGVRAADQGRLVGEALLDQRLVGDREHVAGRGAVARAHLAVAAPR